MSYKEINNQLSHRSSSTMKSSKDSPNVESKTSIIHSPFDEGVVRNGGRRGSKFGPKAIQAQLDKLAFHSHKSTYKTYILSDESECFSKTQSLHTKQIANILESDLTKNVIHLGGGHDHIYPFISAIKKSYKNKNIHIINLDAHLDTRKDDLVHSGTPFRQILKDSPNIRLTQLGIHRYANVIENYQDIPMEVYHMDQLRAQTQNFSNSDFIDQLMKPNELVVLSLDCDALKASDMQAVSAVNHDGIPIEFFKDLLRKIVLREDPSIIGIYEYNPLYDTLAASDARKLAAIIYEEMLI